MSDPVVVLPSDVPSFLGIFAGGLGIGVGVAVWVFRWAIRCADRLDALENHLEEHRAQARRNREDDMDYVHENVQARVLAASRDVVAAALASHGERVKKVLLAERPRDLSDAAYEALLDKELGL